MHARPFRHARLWPQLATNLAPPATLPDQTGLMYDSAAGWSRISLPVGFKYLLAYANGPYANVETGLETGAIVVPISIRNGVAGVPAYDCEPGCVWPVEAVAEVAAEDVRNGLRPCVYSFGSNLGYGQGNNGPVQQAIAGLGTDPAAVDYFLADPDGVFIVPEGYVGKQAAWGPNFGPTAFDTSIIDLSWSALPQPKPPVLPKIGAEGMYIHVVWPGGKEGQTIKSKKGKTYAYGLVVWATPDTGLNLGNSYANVEAGHTAANVPLVLVEDPNGTLLDSIPNHIGF